MEVLKSLSVEVCKCGSVEVWWSASVEVWKSGHREMPCGSLQISNNIIVMKRIKDVTFNRQASYIIIYMFRIYSLFKYSELFLIYLFSHIIKCIIFCLKNDKTLDQLSSQSRSSLYLIITFLYLF